MCEWELLDRWPNTGPVSSFIPLNHPPTIAALLTSRYSHTHTHTQKHPRKELLLKNESDVKPRPDWFTSETTSLWILVGRAGSTIGNLPRFVRKKSLSTLFSLLSPRPPRPFPISSRVSGMTLWGHERHRCLKIHTCCNRQEFFCSKHIDT